MERVHVKDRTAVHSSVPSPVITNMTDHAKRNRTGLPTLRLEQWYYKRVGSNKIGGPTELFLLYSALLLRYVFDELWVACI